MAAPARGATDVLSLGADWEPITTEGALTAKLVEAGGANGDIIAEDVHDTVEAGNAKYEYIGAQAGFIAALDAVTAWPGRLLASDTLLLGSVAIDFSPCAAGKRPIITFGDLRDGPTSEPATPFWYKTALVLPTYAAGAAILVPTLLTVTGGGAECTNCQWSLKAKFEPSLGKTGNYLAGQPFEGRETIVLTFKGIPTSITSTGWKQTGGPSTKLPTTLNTAYPEFTYTFTRAVTRATS